MNEARWPLSPRAARVFYGVADAWLASGADVDVVAALAPQLGSAGRRRRLELTLWLLEWSPRLLLRTDFLSHEEVVLKYDHYFLGSRTRLSYPFDEQMARDPLFRADADVLSLIATLWW